MRAAMGNSGNVEENKSLYWHPSVYMVEPSTGEHTLANIWFASAYYVWETGSTQAFPNGFNMIARASNAKSRVEWECASPQPCQRDDCTTTSTNFPATACAELEVSFVFPTCWDGVNLVSENMMDHVAYDTTATGRFDGDCPASHPSNCRRSTFIFASKTIRVASISLVMVRTFSMPTISAVGTGRSFSGCWMSA